MWKKQGFVLIDDLIDEEQCETVKKMLSDMVIELATEDEALGRTDETQPQRLGSSMLTNRVFWDEAAGQPTSFPLHERERVLSRVGHRLEQIDVVRSVIFSPQIRAYAATLFDQPAIATCAIIDKVPGGSMYFDPHQDSWYITTDPDKILGIWIALDDTDEENGCLFVAPGTSGLGNLAVATNDASWTIRTNSDQPLPVPDMIPLPMRRGTALLFDGHVFHRSEINLSSRRRRAIVCHIVEGDCHLLGDSWLVRPEGGFLTVPKE